MKGKFSDLIRVSLEWTKTILFRPFNFKKWLLICVIAVLSAEFSGCNPNFNYNNGGNGKKDVKVEQEGATVQSGQEADNLGQSAPQEKTNKTLFIFLITVLGILILVLIIFLMWLNSRFSFIFINSIIKNDASIKIPFAENKIVGNSYFRWNLIILAALLAAISIVSGIFTGVYFLLKNQPMIYKALIAVIPGIAFLALVILAFAIIGVITRDFVLPVMYTKKIRIINAWEEIWPVLKKDIFSVVKYFFVKLLLRVLAGIIAGVFMAAVFVAVLVQGIILGGVLFSISLLLPDVLKIVYYIIIGLVLLIALFALIVLINMALLPIPVFFRTFSLKFLARLDDNYNLFITHTEKEA